MIGIGNIISGHINEALGLNKDISEARLRICKKCPIYLSRYGGICNPKLWINPKTNEISTEKKDGYIKGCGCRVLAKTTLVNSHCVANKW